MEYKICDRDAIQSKFKNMMGNKTGVVHSVARLLPPKSSDRPIVTYPNTTDLGRLYNAKDPSDFSLKVGGKGQILRDSMNRSFGEMAERSCLSMCPMIGNFKLCSYNDLLDSESIVVNFDYLRSTVVDKSAFDRDTEVYWVKGRDILSNSYVYVPTSLVWFQTNQPAIESNKFCSTSNGCAAGPTITDALLGSIYELIERDGFMRLWYRGKVPKQYSLPSGHIKTLLRQVEGDSGSVTLIKLDSPLDISAVAALFRSDQEHEASFAVTAHAALSLEEAMAGALIELGQGTQYLKIMLSRYDLSDVNADEAHDFTENTLYYLKDENHDKVDHLFKGDEIEIDNLSNDNYNSREELNRVLSRLHNKNMHPITFDITTEPYLKNGIYVTKVITPELVPLTPATAPPVAHDAFDDEVESTPHPFP